jgi:hypothetical protein
MKFSLSFLPLAVLVISSCDTVDEPPRRTQQVSRTSTTEVRQQYPPQQQPFNPNGPAQPENAAPDASNPPPQPAAPTKVAKGDYPYGIPVPNKPHLVESPYSPGKYVDVEGFSPGTEVKDPYTGKIFLVP